MLKDLGKSVLIYGLASSISKFIGIFLIPIFSRYFSPEEYGSLDLISTVISFVSILGILQLESSISRYFYEVEGDQRKVYISTAFWTILILSVFLQILIIFCADFLSNMLFDSLKFSSVIKFASSNILLLNLFGYLTVVLRFSNKPLLYSAIIFFQFLTTAVVSVILIVYFEKGIISFFVGQVAGLLVGILLMLFYLRHYFTTAIRPVILKSFFSYSLPQVPAVAGNWLNSYANRFIMLEYLSIRDIGIYTVALKIASIFNLIDNAFRMAWEPFLWERIKLANHKELLRELSKSISALVFILALLFMLSSKELIFILSTDAYIDALPIIKLLIFAFSFPVLINIFGIGTSVAKKTIYNTISFFIGVGVNIGMLFILVPFHGLTGVPIALAISNMTILALMWYFSEKLYPIGYNFKLQLIFTLAYTGLALLLFIIEIPLYIKIILAAAVLLTLFFQKDKMVAFLSKKP